MLQIVPGSGRLICQGLRDVNLPPMPLVPEENMPKSSMSIIIYIWGSKEMVDLKILQPVFEVKLNPPI